MKGKWLILLLLLGVGLALLAGCDARNVVTPPSDEAVGPPVQTQEVAPPPPAPASPSPAGLAPTVPSPAVTAPSALPEVQETGVPRPTPSDPEAPVALVAPHLSVRGTMANGIPWGTTGDGQFFKGDPNAPLIMFEFSEYQ